MESYYEMKHKELIYAWASVDNKVYLEIVEALSKVRKQISQKFWKQRPNITRKYD